MERRSFLQILLASTASGLIPNHLLAADGSPLRGGVVTVALPATPTQIVAHNTTGVGAGQIGPKIFEGLFDYDDAFTPLPQIATGWSLSDDGLTYRFPLRAGIRWHDGTPLTSEDVAFSLLLLKQTQPRGRSTFANIEEVDASDPGVAIVRLSAPAPYLIRGLAAVDSPILPKHIFGSFDPINADPQPAQIIGSGPFRLGEWVHGSHIILERNPDYHSPERPLLDRVIYRFIEEAASRAAALEAGEVQVAPVPLADLERFESDPRFRIETRNIAYAGTHTQLAFNLETEVLRDLRVRRAIAHALSPQGIIDVVYYGYGALSPTPIVPGSPYHDASITHYPFDTARSEALLDEAGHPRGANGTRFSLRLTGNTLLPPAFFDYLRTSLARVGIEAQIRRNDFATYTAQVYTERDFDLSIEALQNSYDPTAGVQRLFLSTAFRIGLPFSNPSHYDNPEADRILIAARSETDEERRKALWFELQRLVHDELPVVDLIVPGRALVYDARLGDLIFGAQADSYNFAGLHFTG